jgi:predicted component of type VI protein secretion system
MTRLTVRLAGEHSRPIESRAFSTSPVSVGSGPNSILRLDDRTVSPCQGVLAFTPNVVRYVDCGSPTRSSIDGVLLTAGIPVRLEEASLVEIGRYRFCVELNRYASPPPEMAVNTAELPSVLFSGIGTVRAASLDDANALRSFLERSLKIHDAVSGAIVELRERQLRLGVRSFETSLLGRSWDLHEITDYLLDPSTSAEARAVEIGRYLIDLAQGGPRFTGWGQG